MKIAGLILAFLLSFATAAADFAGVPIVYPSGVTAFEKEAIADLQSVLQQATGRDVPLLPEKQFRGGPSIQIGSTTENLRCFAGEVYPTRQSWRIRTEKDTIHITGGGPSGVVYGIYDFLNRNGIWFLSEDCTVIPEMEKLDCTGLDVKQTPSFVTREIYDGLYGIADWKDSDRPRMRYANRRRNFQVILPQDQADMFRISFATKKICHSFYCYLPPEKYAGTHPEYYSMDKEGKRVCNPEGGSQLCLSNPDVRRLVKEQLLEWIAQDRKKCKEKNLPVPMLYDFSQQDNGTYLCCCPACQELVRKYGNDCGLLLDMVNELAREAAKVYPGVYIQTFAYVYTEEPPERIEPEKNVVIRYCDLYSRSNCFFPLRTQETQRDLLLRWLAKTPNVNLWDYWNMGGFEGAQAPGMIVDSVIDDLKFFHEGKVPGLFLEAEVAPYRPQSFITLQYFLGAQLMKDASQDAETLIGFFFRNYYGPAADDVRRYFDLLRDTIRKSDPALNRQYSFCTIPFLLKSREILLLALRKAGDDPAFRKRVLDEMNSISYALIRKTAGEDIPGLNRDQLIRDYRGDMIFALDNNWMVTPAGRKRALASLESDVAFFNVNYALPKELAGYPAEKILRLGYPQFPYGYIDARIVHDPESEMIKSLAFLPSDPNKHSLPFLMGVYDKLSKTHLLECALTPSARDEKYHWYRLGQVRLGRDTIIWGSPSWHMVIYLKEFFVNDDGMDDTDNPNICDIWVNIRFSGSAYIEGSESANGVYIDKIVLSRKN